MTQDFIKPSKKMPLAKKISDIREEVILRGQETIEDFAYLAIFFIILFVLISNLL